MCKKFLTTQMQTYLNFQIQILILTHPEIKSCFQKIRFMTDQSI